MLEGQASSLLYTIRADLQRLLQVAYELDNQELATAASQALGALGHHFGL
jgi:hypothetical protein